MMRTHREEGDTIAAIATPLGTGGVGVIRVSGPESLRILKRIFHKAGKDSFPHKFCSHRAVFGQLFFSDKKQLIDNCLVTYMKGPHSYTGEDVVEIGLHGSVPVLREVLRMIIVKGARLAERGEFTRRAFMNRRIDLVQAEAVLDIIGARTIVGATRAAGQMAGRLSGEINAMREKLLLLLAEIEARIDFPEDLARLPAREIRNKISIIQKKVRQLLATAEEGRIMREGARVAIVGRPNVGKSSLYNALLREERAIVTEEPGTTRDVLEEGLNILGLPICVVDTAGLRVPRGRAEALGVERARGKGREADLVLLVVDGARSCGREDEKVFSFCQEKEVLLVINKCDLPVRFRVPEKIRYRCHGRRARVSALTGKGIGGLERLIFRQLTKSSGVKAGQILINLRHQQCLLRAEKALGEVLFARRKQLPDDMLAIGLKDAIMALGEITGAVVTEEVLDKIFSQFCVGK
jgi:tRNA modification GTPase